MQQMNILVIGGGIGGLTSAIALGKDGHKVTVIERDPQWSVYGVGIIQQGNVLRAMNQLGLLDDYLAASVGFDFVAVHAPNGAMVAKIPSPKLVDGCPANVGIGRRALQKLLADHTLASGAEVRLGVTANSFDDDGQGVTVAFSDGTSSRYDIVIGADGVHSQTRGMLFPDLDGPQFTGQAVWRYNMPRSEGLDSLHVYNGPTGAGLVPISKDLMYIYLTTPEPDNPRYPTEGLAARMVEKMAGLAGEVGALARHVTDDEAVVYRPLEGMMLRGDWHKGRVVMLGDAVHATTPHLGQGAGMAIEDSIVLAEELARAATPDEAFAAYRARRFERCAYIVDRSLEICMGQLGKGPPVDNAKATADMFQVVAQSI
ncbi:FAD-dependent oxidoreductase [Altererythrobacter sp. KTW20L]|uniref:FAD-dependent oxidoreductase n=1 Tax=Altererythrobacter sp. KTW20L TaxID=2942210 RepID=UPI0020BD6190|nr:FAD-dependent oxidoreductase [Altererythrobacter sp. KTW20L]MCL6250685.1 FAD-dependent oxidoreductase [Altererythrobacter sp. KTW20L]